MKDLLLEHLIKYPYMEVQDLVKLIYQNEFAGGHMILDKKISLIRLQKERETLKEVPSFEVDLFEDIGNDLCRLHLASLKDSSLSSQTINCLFVYTASGNTGTLASFEAKLKKLLSYCKSGELPFSFAEVEAYLMHYKIQGYPAVHHSDAFHLHYEPAYRVIKKEFKAYYELFCSIDALAEKSASINIAIDGNSASGKSTLAATLASVYDCNLFHMDDFFLRPEQKTPERQKELGGNVDYMRFKEEVADRIGKKETFTYQIYNCSIGKLTEYVTVTPKKINIVEGVYSLHPMLQHMYQLKIFMTIDPLYQSKRILERSGASLHQRFITEWIPLENAYFTALQVGKLADLTYVSKTSSGNISTSCLPLS